MYRRRLDHRGHRVALAQIQFPRRLRRDHRHQRKSAIEFDARQRPFQHHRAHRPREPVARARCLRGSRVTATSSARMQANTGPLSPPSTHCRRAVAHRQREQARFARDDLARAEYSPRPPIPPLARRRAAGRLPAPARPGECGLPPSPPSNRPARSLPCDRASPRCWARRPPAACAAVPAACASRVAASSAESGSSSSNSAGPAASARASATRCCCPPEIARGNASAQFAPARMPRSVARAFSRGAAYATFAATVRCGNSA